MSPGEAEGGWLRNQAASCMQTRPTLQQSDERLKAILQTGRWRKDRHRYRLLFRGWLKVDERRVAASRSKKNGVTDTGA